MQRFTDAVEQSLQNKNWLAALFMSLALPDICGALEGKKGVRARYEDWFKTYLSAKYNPNFTASDCYYFRCACIHEGLDKHADLTFQRVHIIEPPPHNIQVHMNMIRGVCQIQIDLFCRDMCDAVRQWEINQMSQSAVQQRIQELIEVYPYTTIAGFVKVR